ncbi:MAG: ArdC-like ssDNA-binding domain-containing protein [Deferrisomatales bacterium]
MPEWRRTWTGSEPLRNPATRKPYRGINVFLLGMQGFGSPYWLTLKQTNRLGVRTAARERRGQRPVRMSLGSSTRGLRTAGDTNLCSPAHLLRQGLTRFAIRE